MLTPADILHAYSYVTAVWGRDTKFELHGMDDEDECHVLIDGTFQLWKEDRLFKTGRWVYHGGSYWEPPDSDLEEDDPSETLHDALMGLFLHVLETTMADVANAIWEDEQYQLDKTEEVLSA
jgi:hypothetical protein